MVPTHLNCSINQQEKKSYKKSFAFFSITKQNKRPKHRQAQYLNQVLAIYIERGFWSLSDDDEKSNTRKIIGVKLLSLPLRQYQLHNNILKTVNCVFVVQKRSEIYK